MTKPKPKATEEEAVEPDEEVEEASAAPEPVEPKIAEALTEQIVPIDSIEPHPENPREGYVPAIAESLEVNSQYRAIVVQDSTGYILAGNHTWLAAKGLGWTGIAAVRIDVDDDEARRIMLADNRTAELGGFNDENLHALLLGVQEMEGGLIGTGYDDDYVEELFGIMDLPSPIEIQRNRGEGEKVQGVVLTWGYMQWKSTRVQITEDEVQALDEVLRAFVMERSTDLGFGHFLTDGKPRQAKRGAKGDEIDLSGGEEPEEEFE